MTLYFLIAEIVFGFVSISVFPVLRAMMSKLVESEEQGELTKIFLNNIF